MDNDKERRPPNLPEIENLDQMIKDVREIVQKEYEKNKDLFDELDYQRIMNSDWTVERFIRRRKTVKDSAEMIINTGKFLKDLQIARIKDEDFPQEFFKMGAVFRWKPDKFGNGTFFMRVRLNRKVKELERAVKQFLMYQIFKLDEETNGHGMAIIFDCKGAGLSNLDMDLLWFLVSSLLNYFPYGMSYILVYDLPWVLSSVWNVVKGWLPAETRNKIKFASKDEIYDYFDKESLPLYLGGTCKLNYHHVPKGCLPAEERGRQEGWPEKDINRMKKLYKDCLEEADEEIKVLTSSN